MEYVSYVRGFVFFLLALAGVLLIAFLASVRGWTDYFRSNRKERSYFWSSF